MSKVTGVVQLVSALEAENTALKAERDALLAKNKELIGLVLRMRDRWWPFVHGSIGRSTTAYQLGKESADIICKTPQQCLLDVRADAIQSIADDDFIAHVTKLCGSYNAMLVYDYVQVRAATVRQGGAE